MQTEASGHPRPFPPGGRDRPVLWGPTAHGAAGRWGAEDTGSLRLPKAKRGGAACQTGAPFLRGQAGPQSQSPAGPLQKLVSVVHSGGFVVGRSQSARGQVPTLEQGQAGSTPTAVVPLQNLGRRLTRQPGHPL